MTCMENCQMKLEHKKQKGQVLPLVTIFLLAICAAVFFMFNSTQMAQEKMRLTNATDAALYAGGIRTARVMNIIAYTNRSTFLQHTAIAQATSMASWVVYLRTLSQNLGDYADLIYPGLGQAIKAAGQMMRIYEGLLMGAMQQHDVSLKYLDSVQHGHTEGWTQAEMGTQNWADSPEDKGGRMAIMRHLMRWNYHKEKYGDQEFASLAEENRYIGDMETEWLEDNFNDFLYNYVSRPERARMGELLVQDVDKYTTKRKFDLGVDGIGSVKRRGGTELVNLADGWASMDTLSIHVLGGLFGGGGEEPLGYGTAATNKYSKDKRLDYGGSRSANPKAYNEAFDNHTMGFGIDEGTMEGSASGNLKPLEGVGVYDKNANAVAMGMVHPYQDLPLGTSGDPIIKSTAMAFRKVRANMISNGDSTANSNANKPGGRLDVFEGNLKKDKEAEMGAVASFEVFFERPDRRDGKKEIANTFSPYWHVRMVEVTDEMRSAAQTKRPKGMKLTTPL